MPNENWICFHCRKSRRVGTTHFHTDVGTVGEGHVFCLSCDRPCYCLGHRIELPKKNDAAGWKQLQGWCEDRQTTIRDQNVQTQTRRRHEIEKRILELQSRPSNPDRERRIRALQKQLNDA